MKVLAVKPMLRNSISFRWWDKGSRLPTSIQVEGSKQGGCPRKRSVQIKLKSQIEQQKVMVLEKSANHGSGQDMKIWPGPYVPCRPAALLVWRLWRHISSGSHTPHESGNQEVSSRWPQPSAPRLRTTFSLQSSKQIYTRHGQEHLAPINDCICHTLYIKASDIIPIEKDWLVRYTSLFHFQLLCVQGPLITSYHGRQARVWLAPLKTSLPQTAMWQMKKEQSQVKHRKLSVTRTLQTRTLLLNATGSQCARKFFIG